MYLIPTLISSPPLNQYKILCFFVQGIGTVSYAILDDNKNEHIITVLGVLHVPSCSSRLICPRQLHLLTKDPSVDSGLGQLK